MRTHWAAPALLAAVMAAGCSDSNGPAGSTPTGLGTNATDQPHVALTITPGESVVAPEPGGGYTITDGGNTLLLTKAEVVLAGIELKQGCNGAGTRGDGHSDDDSHDGGSHDDGSDDGHSDDSHSDDSHSDDSSSDDSSSDDDAAEFEAGPFLLDVPLGRGTETLVSVAVPAGTYGRIEFEIRRLSSHLFDADVLEAHPDLVGSSIRIEGTFDDGNGATSFVYRTDLGMRRKIDLETPLIVDETSGDTELTVHLGLDMWFVDDAGTLIDPATANHGGVNERRVEGNIRDAMDAFEVHRH
ncbi:hypothetical protein K8I85_07030 [bacterium]|nr:hypothetical protein [bacterium]